MTDVVSYKIEDGDLIVLKQLENVSELLRISNGSTIVWNCKVPKSYDFLILKELIYVTTTDSAQTFVVNKNSGSNLRKLSNLVLHLPVSYQTKNWVVSYATYNEAKSGILFDSKMNVVTRLNPDNMKVTKVINKDSFISFDKGLLTLVDFLTSHIVWSIDLLKEVTTRSNEDNVKLRFLAGIVLEKVIVVSMFNVKSNTQYLIGLETQTGKVNWYKKSVMNFVGLRNYLYSLTREGRIDIFDLETGLLLRSKDLSTLFSEQNIHCSRGLKIEGNTVLFKDEENKKVGAINFTSLDLEFVQAYPKNSNLSPDEYPHILGDKMILHDPLAKKLHLVGLEHKPIEF